jgi:3'-phosphoadenosine 5'-phosphosulfate sulfotransferase (PAPS reductase)/FAD synthetase
VSDPFKIDGPAVISFSGGRTSGMLANRILQAHAFKLPADVFLCFQNTGKERPETLDFIERCACEWGVPIVWLEYRAGKQFAVVDYATANRTGEPLRAAMRDRRFVPNPSARICTIECKLLTLLRYIESLGWEQWANVIGFRADESARVAKRRASADDREELLFPLHAVGVSSADVMRFWAAQPFDLQLGANEGNCDLCFLKKPGTIQRLIRKWPGAERWWADVEAETGSLFRSDRPRYATLAELSKRESLPMMGDDEPDELSIACHCTD